MGNGQAKISLLLELKNKLKAGLQSAKKIVSDDVQAMKDKLNSLKSTHIDAFKSMKEEVPGFGRAMEVLGNPYVLITAGLTTLISLYGSARAEAAQWDNSMAKVNVTAQLGKKELGELSDHILEIGARNTAPLQAVPEAFNKIISAGLDTDTALKTLEPTLQAAKAGFTDVDVVAKAAVSTMTSSGIMDANRVYDILFATLNKGNAEFADIAQYLPKIIPMAKAAGYSLEQVAGSFAFLTAQGMSSEQSSTGLTNLFKSLSDNDIINGSKTKLGLKGLGIDVFDAKGEAKPLIDIIDQLKAKTESLTGSDKVKFFDQIGFDMETSTAIASMTQNVDKLRENIDFTTNSTGQLSAAVENSKTATESWDVAGNMIKKTMIDIGQPINESFGRLGEELLPLLQPMLETFQTLLSGIWDILSAVGEIAGAILKPFINIGKTILEWFNKSEILKDVFEGIKIMLKGVVTVVEWLADKLGWIFEHTLKPILDGIDWAYKKIKELLPTTAVGDVAKEIIEKQNKANNPYYGYAGYEHDALGIPIAPKTPPTGMNAYGFPATNLYDGKKTSPLNFDKPGKEKKSKDGSGTSITGKAEQVRNITIHVQTIGVNGDFVSQNTDFKNMNKRDLQNFFQELLARFGQNLETSYV